MKQERTLNREGSEARRERGIQKKKTRIVKYATGNGSGNRREVERSGITVKT